jgi:putative nucleotidyltransferase with HDIG domain
MTDETASEESVREVLEPELSMISNPDLRDKAVKAWTMACRMGGYKRLEDCPTEQFDRLPNTPNIEHQKQTARLAAAIVKALKEAGNPANVDEDCAITAALCHDLGKPVEWRADAPGMFYEGVYYGKNPNMPPLEDTSYQAARHPVWGFHIALSVGMPERIAHAIGMHSREGDNIRRSPESIVVHLADQLWWQLIGQPKITEKAWWRESKMTRVKVPSRVLREP